MAEKVAMALEKSHKKVERRKKLEQREVAGGTLRNKDKTQLMGRVPDVVPRYRAHRKNYRRSSEASSTRMSFGFLQLGKSSFPGRAMILIDPMRSPSDGIGIQ